MSIIRPTRRDLLKYALPAGLIATRGLQAAPPYKWAFQQQTTGVNVVAGTTKAFTVPATPAGRALVLFCASQATTVNRVINSVTQTNVNWQATGAAIPFGASPLLRNVEIMLGLTNGTTGTTLTVNFSGSNAAAVMVLAEFTYASATGTPIAVSSGEGHDNTGSTAVNSNGDRQAITDLRNQLVVACVGYGDLAAVSANPSGYQNLTAINSGVSLGLQANYRILSSIGNQSPTWTLANSAVWGAGVAVMSGLTNPIMSQGSVV